MENELNTNTNKKIVDAYPLTSLQKGMLFESLANPEKNINIAFVKFDIAGELNSDVITNAWNSTVKKYSALRTVFLWEGLDQPLQAVLETCPLDIEIEDCSHVPQERLQEHSERSLARMRQTIFEPGKAPLMKLLVLNWNKEQSTVIWIIHHLIADAWSAPQVIQAFLDECGRLDGSICSDSIVEYKFSEYVQYLNTQNQQSIEDYWKQYLKGAEWSRFNLPYPQSSIKLANTEQLANGHDLGKTIKQKPYIEYELDVSLYEKIDEFCASNSCTLSSYVHGLWAIVVSAYSNTTSPVFGSLFSGRYAGERGLNTAVGPFVNTLPLFIKLTNDEIYGQWLSRVQLLIQDNQRYESADLQQVRKFVSPASAQSVFDSIVVMEPEFAYANMTSADERIVVRNIEYDVDNSIPLSLVTYPSKTITLKLVFDEDRFDKLFIEQILSDIQFLLSESVSNTDATSIDLLDRLLKTYSSPITTMLGSSSKTNEFLHVSDWFDHTATLHSDKPSLTSTSIELDYQSFQKRVGQLSRNLHEVTCGGNETVAICADSVWMQIVSMFSVLESRNHYTIIDPESSAERIQMILRKSKCRSAIVDIDSEDVFTDLVENVIEFETASAGSSSVMKNQKRLKIGGESDVNITDEPAYLMFTSGSTGTPKGVVVSHANLMYSTQARLNYYGAQKPCFMLVSPAWFDSSVVGIYWSLLVGGQLIVPERDEIRDIQLIGSLIEKQTVNTILCLPSFYKLLMDGTSSGQLDSLTTVILAGESCPIDIVEQHLKDYPNIELFNEYGPTECTVWSSVAKLDSAEMPVSIGMPIPGSSINICDSRGESVPKGAFGEIIITGPGVTSGYLDQADKTDEKFKRNLIGGIPTYSYSTGDVGSWSESGQILFHGRKDRQIKIRGHRIEPEEIESIAIQHENVSNCIALGRSGSTSSSVLESEYTSLDLYVCLTDTDSGKDEKDDRNGQKLCQELSTMLSDVLPSYMRPSSILVIESIPVSANGKIDLNALSTVETIFQYSGRELEATSNSQALAESSSNNEVLLDNLVSIAKQILEVSDIYASDTFYELGGDSILAIMFVSKAREQGINVSIKQVADQNTFEHMANELAAEIEVTPTTNATILDTGKTPLTPIQQWYFSLSNPRPELWNVAYRIRMEKTKTTASLLNAISRTLERNSALGSRFTKVSDSYECEIPEYDNQNSQTVILKAHNGSLSDDVIKDELRKISYSWKLEEGRLLGFLIVDIDDGQAKELYLIGHHLVLDHFSISQLVQQIVGSEYECTSSKLVADEMQFREYAELLSESVPDLDASRWSQFDSPEESLVKPVTTEGRSYWKELVLNRQDTEDLLSNTKRWNVNVLEVLVSVFELAWKQCADGNMIDLYVESGGRDASVVPNSSAVVGWLTGFHPLNKFEFNYSSSLELIKSVKNELRQNREADALFLKWFYQKHNSHPAAFSKGCSLLVNYFGQVDHVNTDDQFILDGYAMDGLRDTDAVRAFDIELNAYIDNEMLHMKWHLASSINSELMESINTQIIAEISKLNEIEMGDNNSSMYTPSDFSSLNMSQEEMDKMMDDIG